MRVKEHPPNVKKISSLERSLIGIEIKKHPEPILSPENFDWATSIRNPAAFRYGKRYGLLCTVRHSKDNKSRLHLAWSNDGTEFDLEREPFINTDLDSLLAVEDARITKIDDEYLITFTAFKETDGKTYNTTRIGLIKTKDFKTTYDRSILIDKKANNKNGLIFKDEDFYWIIDRPFDNGDGLCSEPLYAQISNTKKFPDFNNFKPFLKPRKNMWDDARVGINIPPIKIIHNSYGKTLLMFYHGANKIDNKYSMGYIITDEKNPTNILERSKKPLLFPELDWEIGRGKYGAEVPNVVFGCGAIPIGKNKIRIYYAGADRYTGFADLILKNAKIIDSFSS